LGLAAHGLADEIASERRVILQRPSARVLYGSSLGFLARIQALARARARIAREEHIEHVEGHDVLREETNTRSLVHLIHRNRAALRQEQPQLQVTYYAETVFAASNSFSSEHQLSCDPNSGGSIVRSAPRCGQNPSCHETRKSSGEDEAAMLVAHSSWLTIPSGAIASA
jgi:hypothetical protein